MTNEQPVAWANEDDDGIYEVGLSEAHALYALERARDGKLSHRNPRVAPLYRSPTLTECERVAMRFFLEKHRKIQREGEHYCCFEASQHADAIQGLLERLA
jgi:hypothetical protein